MHPVGQLQMAQHDGAASHGAMRANARAAGHPHATGHGRMLADVHVVTDLDQVVELDPVLDHRVVQRSAVYAGIGADFHIVADPHATELLDLHPCSVLGSKPEAVRSQHHAGMQQTARPHMAVLANSDARLQDRKSTRLNSSHLVISYAVFCLTKKMS